MFALRTLLGLTGVAAAGLAYAAGYEVRAFRLRRYDVPVLAPGSRPIRLLHLSDLHLRPGQKRKIEWVRRLAGLEPDLVVTTGDNLAHPDAVPAVLQAYEPLLDTPGVFVFGSNDYFSPKPKNPASYLLPKDGVVPDREPDLPWGRLRDELTDAGWLDLSNRSGELTIDHRRLSFAGVDDPHLGYDRHLSGPADPGADLAIGVSHAPYLRVLDTLAADGYRLLLAGHTHGGQLCVPGYGALVTNCDLDTGRVKGLSRHPDDGGTDASWLHVSAGLGTSPYAPVRFACPPEATLLTLVES